MEASQHEQQHTDHQENKGYHRRWHCRFGHNKIDINWQREHHSRQGPTKCHQYFVSPFIKGQNFSQYYYEAMKEL